MDVINAVKSSALNVAEYFTPVLKESRFKETGVLTPEEFVAAGDHLVHHCPTWYWSRGAKEKIKPYLPSDKQLLMTKNVPCYRRFKQIDCLIGEEKVIDGDDVDSGWVDTHFFSPETAADKFKEMTLENKPPNINMESNDDDDEGGLSADMEAFFKEGLVDMKEDPYEAKPDPEDLEKIVRTRTYDLNITYDKYYQTPRMWLSGFSEKGKYLTIEQMYEDFSDEHAKKTITIENHPHLPGPPMASIHPCRHAEVMKRLLEQLAENGKELHVYQYLIVFLKFLQAVIPTIEYDFTRNITL